MGIYREELTILLGITGSRRWGVETEDSDVDIRGVYIQDPRTYWSTFTGPWKASAQRRDLYSTTEGNKDIKLWDARRFVGFLLGGNPECHRFLWIPARLRKTTSPGLGRLLIKHRKEFVNQKLVNQCMGEARGRYRCLNEMGEQGLIKPMGAAAIRAHVKGTFLSLMDVSCLTSLGEMSTNLTPTTKETLDNFLSSDTPLPMFLDWAKTKIRKMKLALEDVTLPEPDEEYLNQILLEGMEIDWNDNGYLRTETMEGPGLHPGSPGESTSGARDNDLVRQKAKRVRRNLKRWQGPPIPMLVSQGCDQQGHDGQESTNSGHRPHVRRVPDRSPESRNGQDTCEEQKHNSPVEDPEDSDSHYGPP